MATAAILLSIATLTSGQVTGAALNAPPEPRRQTFCIGVPEGAVILVRLMVDKNGQAIGDLKPMVMGADPADLEEAQDRAVAAVRTNLPLNDLPPEAAYRPIVIKFDLDEICGN